MLTDTPRPEPNGTTPKPLTPAEQLARFEQVVQKIDYDGEGAPVHEAAKSQSEWFMQAARELECDDDPERFAERVRRLVKTPNKYQAPVGGGGRSPKSRS